MNNLDVPTIKSVTSTIIRSRANFVPIVNSGPRSSIAIQDEFKKTLVELETFLQFDVKSEIDDFRMLIFYTEEFFSPLCLSDLLVLDETFYCAPVGFAQLYVFHFKVGDGFLPGMPLNDLVICNLKLN